MENLVRRLGRIFTSKRKTVRESPSALPEDRMERLEKVLPAWLERKGWRDPARTLGDAAEALGTDTVTLYHFFNERIGVDFRTWRNRLRLEDACRLLVEEPGTRAADIGRKAGFTDRSNFAREFLAYTGCTPAQWREKGRGDLTTSPSRKTIM